MKILIFNTLYHPYRLGGAEKSVQLLAEGLVKRNNKIIVVSTTTDKDYVSYINGVKIYYVKPTNLYPPFKSKEERKYKKPIWHFLDSYNPFVKKIKEILLMEKPDIVHTNNLAGFSVNVWRLSKKKNIKIVHTLRDYYLLCPRSTMFNEKKNKSCDKQCLTCKVYSFPKKILSQTVDAVVGISNFILNEHLSYGYFSKTKIRKVIFNSVNKPDYPIKKIKKNNDYIIFGYVGSLSPSKGVEFLLDNFRKVAPENTKLFVYGKGINNKYEQYLKEKYRHESIEFKGFREPEEIYSTIDILIVPSLWKEPFGRIVPEANSYNIPILASNKGALPELVHNGVNGYIFDIDSNEDFRRKMDLIIKKWKDKKFVFDIKPYESERIIDSYVKLYNDVIQL